MTYGPHITSMYGELEKPRKIGHLLVAIDPQRFAGAATLADTAEAMIAELRTRGEVLFPGEPEMRHEAERLAEGIPVEPAALADMNEWSARLGVPEPSPQPSPKGEGENQRGAK
jgi:ureidoglycolate dehydrogenase (NAD+)